MGIGLQAQTDDMREAPSVDILPRLLKMGAKVKAYDPEAIETARRLIRGVNFCKNPYDAARGADALLLLTEWNEFKEADFGRLKSLMKGHVVVDGRNLYDPAEMAQRGFRYEGMGRSAHQPSWRSADRS
jgi:UDPglucose 6-dehydrogenase